MFYPNQKRYAYKPASVQKNPTSQFRLSSIAKLTFFAHSNKPNKAIGKENPI
ncbi:hypothetical protein CYCD_03050 [Tenuifilaceae bacterium CYCD]|nr:hypothetical protein CYCD_03050 [Tenuifilaceae bacterium CYCD]